MSERKRVMLLIGSSRAYGRGCLLGVAAYVRSHGRWSVLHIERGLTESVPKFLKSWKGDGIIARIETREIARAVRRMKLPVVDVSAARHLRRRTERSLNRSVDKFSFCDTATAALTTHLTSAQRERIQRSAA